MIEIRDKKSCCGCGACAASCPQNCICMTEDEEGFLYPVVDSKKCVNCRLCEKVCPVINVEPDTPKAGFEQIGYVVQNRDSEVLRESTAGGAFTAIAKYVLDQGGVVFGAELQENLLAHPSPVRHTWVETEEDLRRFRNSKYVQSYVDVDVYSQLLFFLKQGRKVCFSGTPCQVEGVDRYLKTHGGERYRDQMLLVDIVCRCVPSPLIFRKYVESQSERLEESVHSIRFRDKHYGYSFSTLCVETERKKHYRGSESDPWLRAFLSGIDCRPSCHACAFKKRYRVSDVTIWDCYTVYRFDKALDNNKGATRVLVHTPQGARMMREIESSFRYCKVAPDKLTAGVYELTGSAEKNIRRSQFFEDAATMNGPELFKKYFPDDLKTKAKQIARVTLYYSGLYQWVNKQYKKRK